MIITTTMFSNFMELVPDAAIILDVKTDKVTYVNTSCKKLLNIDLGYTARECYGQMTHEELSFEARDKTQEQIKNQGVLITEHVLVKTKKNEDTHFDVRISYTDDTCQSVFVIFTRSARVIEEMSYRTQRYDARAEASFSYPFYLNVADKRMEFFGPIREEFQLPPVMENFPQPVLDGGNILPEDLPAYRRMIDRMYKGEPPAESFRCYTPAGNILKYAVNYVVNRN